MTKVDKLFIDRWLRKCTREWSTYKWAQSSCYEQFTTDLQCLGLNISEREFVKTVLSLRPSVSVYKEKGKWVFEGLSPKLLVGNELNSQEVPKSAEQTCYTRMIQEAPTSAEIRVATVVVQEAPKKPEQIICYTRVIQEAPKSPEQMIVAVRVVKEAPKNAEQRIAYVAAVQETPESAEQG